jgi:hypothetical protein
VTSKLKTEERKQLARSTETAEKSAHAGAEDLEGVTLQSDTEDPGHNGDRDGSACLGLATSATRAPLESGADGTNLGDTELEKEKQSWTDKPKNNDNQAATELTSSNTKATDLA